MSALLEIEGVEARYGDFQALWGVDLTVEEGERIAVMGANGAGKSTLLSTVTGLLPPSAGSVRFDGLDLAGIAPHRRPTLGIALVPEGRRIFASLTVEENLKIGARCGRKGPWTTKTVVEALPLLDGLGSRSGDTLSGGQQQALAIGRALMANPRLLLLDELSLGLAPIVIDGLYDILGHIGEQGTTVVLVEQDVKRALAATDRATCLLEGRVSLQGRSAELSPEAIVEAYFGLGRTA